MFSEEVDWMTRFRRAGWKVLFFPGAEVVHVGGASHGGTALRREPARAPALLRQAPRAEEAERVRRLLLVVAAPARGASLRRDEYREGVRFLRSGDAGRCSTQVIVYLRLAFGTLVRPRARLGRRARARAAHASPRCSPGRSPSSSSRGRPSSRCTARSTSPSLVLALIFVACAGRPAQAARREPAFASATGLGSGSLGVVLGWFLWHVEGAVTGDGLFHEARVRKLVDLTAPAPAHASTSSRTAACTPATRSRSGTGSSRSSRGSRASTPAIVVRHEPSLLAPLACAVAWEAGVAVFGSRARRRVAPRR